MAALPPRHEWCAQKILLCFAEEKENACVPSESQILSFLRKPKVLARFDDLCAGTGPAALFVHFQPRVQLDELEALDQKSGGKAELLLSDGTSLPINRKCCYFLRAGENVDSSVANDASLLYGELLDSPLDTFRSLLSSTYAPLFAESSEWGSATDEQKGDFNDEMNKFGRHLTSAVDSVSGGLELRHLESAHLESLEATAGQPGAHNPEAVAHLQDLLGEWCGQIEEFVASRENPSSSGPESTADGRGAAADRLEGPRGEIEHWRARTQHLSSIIEQVKRRDCRYVVSVLSACSKGRTGDPVKSKTVALLRRWKQMDIEATEAMNEAKDNLKYLSTLQRFVEPLYSGTAQSIIDTLPALVNSIKVRTWGTLPLLLVFPRSPPHT